MLPGWHVRHTHSIQYILGYYGEVRHVRNACAKAKAEPGADEGPGADYVSSIHVSVPDSLEYKASRPLAVGINALALINARTFRDEDEVALTELVLSNVRRRWALSDTLLVLSAGRTSVLSFGFGCGRN